MGVRRFLGLLAVLALLGTAVGVGVGRLGGEASTLGPAAKPPPSPDAHQPGAARLHGRDAVGLEGARPSPADVLVPEGEDEETLDSGTVTGRVVGPAGLPVPGTSAGTRTPGPGDSFSSKRARSSSPTSSP